MTGAQDPGKQDNDPSHVTSVEARRVLESRTRTLFGERTDRQPRILVTLPTESAHDARLCSRLIDAGMDCARIDCAYDDAETWRRMIANVLDAAAAAGRTCSILMDLAGRKPRTGPIVNAPSVSHIKPTRDAIGRPIGPAEIMLLGPGTALPENAPRYHFEIPEALATKLQIGDRLGFDDTRGKSRELLIVDRPGKGLWMAHAFRAAWLTPETNVHLLRRTHKGGLRSQPSEYRFTGFTPRTLRIRVNTGDTLLLSYDSILGEPAQFDANGRTLQPARIGCIECGTLKDVGVGDPVWIDNGCIGAEVVERREEGLLLRITRTRTGGQSVKAGRGLSFPRSPRALQALTDKDIADLDFVVRNADMVGLSCVEEPADLEQLFSELHSRQASHLGVIAKIGNAHAAHILPDLLLTALGRHPFGLMISRADLAVELGVECLHEMMDKILSQSEAAHIPVIWATQLFETLAKEGTVSPPELSEAGLDRRAACVMLDRGPYLLDALQTLTGMLRRTERWRGKNTPCARALTYASGGHGETETNLADGSVQIVHHTP